MPTYWDINILSPSAVRTQLAQHRVQNRPSRAAIERQLVERALYEPRTLAEVSERTGVNRKAVAKHARALERAGRLEIVGESDAGPLLHLTEGE